VSHRFFDHTADVGVDIEAPDHASLFTEALCAFTDTLTPLAGVGAADGSPVEREIELEAESLDELMVSWLEELLFLFEVESLLFFAAELRVEEEAEGWRLRASARGEIYDPDRHPLKVLIKGVTYHELSVEERPEGWRARVIFDI
jgi:SHS2 domain-containing protein